MIYDQNFENFYKDLIENGTNEELRLGALKGERKALQKSTIILVAAFLISVLLCVFTPIIVLKLFPNANLSSDFLAKLMVILTIPWIIYWLEENSQRKTIKRQGVNPYLYIQFVKSSMVSGIFTALGEKRIINSGNQYNYLVDRGYSDAKFKKGNRFKIGDIVSGPLNNSSKFLLSEVWTYDEHSDSDGNKTIVTVFKGDFIKVDFSKEIHDCIRIKRNTTGLTRALRQKSDMDQYLKLDSEEFEKYFDIYCENKVLGMRLFTPDIMEKILSINSNYRINDNYKTQFEATISSNSLYITIPNVLDLFELDKKLQPKKESVYQYYNCVRTILQIVYNWCDIINNFEE